jgi:hypothetical protein
VARQGVFIANQLNISAVTAQTVKQHNWADYVETLITFNGGGRWQHVKVRPPISVGHYDLSMSMPCRK